MSNEARKKKVILDEQGRFETLEFTGLEEIDIPKVGPGSGMVMCAGFEDRSVEVLDRVARHGVQEFGLIIIKYMPEYEENKIDELRRLSKIGDVQVREVTYNREAPAGFGDLMRQWCAEYSHVVVDISAMSRLLIVQVLVGILSGSNGKVGVLYTEAKEYPPDRRTVEKDKRKGARKEGMGYLSSGVFEIVAASELSSVAMVGEPVRLIAFPSFDSAQLSTLVQEVQPTYIDVVHGIPPTEELGWRTKAVKELNQLVLEQREVVDQYEACTLNYQETLEILLGIYGSRSAHDRLVIAPTGSKMQAVAVAMFKSVFRDVQIVYPTPQVFSKPNEYTKGVQRLYQLEIPSQLLVGD